MVSVYTIYNQACFYPSAMFLLDTIDTSKPSNRRVSKYHLAYIHKQILIIYNVSTYKTTNQFKHKQTYYHLQKHDYIIYIHVLSNYTKPESKPQDPT